MTGLPAPPVAHRADHRCHRCHRAKRQMGAACSRRRTSAPSSPTVPARTCPPSKVSVQALRALPARPLCRSRRARAHTPAHPAEVMVAKPEEHKVELAKILQVRALPRPPPPRQPRIATIECKTNSRWRIDPIYQYPHRTREKRARRPFDVEYMLATPARRWHPQHRPPQLSTTSSSSSSPPSPPLLLHTPPTHPVSLLHHALLLPAGPPGALRNGRPRRQAD